MAVGHCFSPREMRCVLPRVPVTEDVGGQLVFLGTGTSHGVPMIGCGCPTCTSPNEKNRRMRCSVVVGLPQGNLLIDTPPELRIQLIRERIGMIHSVLYTHAHADHLFGLDDLRLFPRYLGHELPIYCTESVEKSIRRSFGYAFDPAVQAYPAGGVPKLAFERIASAPFGVLGRSVVPIPLVHGRMGSLGFRIGDIAYCTDVKEIPPDSMLLLQGLDVLVLDSLRLSPHATHMSLDEAVETARLVAAGRTLFTHLSHQLEHEETNRKLPRGMELAYDGLRITMRDGGRTKLA